MDVIQAEVDDASFSGFGDWSSLFASQLASLTCMMFFESSIDRDHLWS